MERVIVVGAPGSGKSTLAHRLAAVLDCPHVVLDGLWWGPNWTGVGPEVFGEQVRAETEGERWVADGNYFSQGSREVLWPRADTIIWLDLPPRITVPRVIRRTLSRSLRRRELWHGNRERFGRILDSDSIIRFAWRAHPGYGLRYEGMDADPDLAHLTWVRLRSPREARRWMRSLDEQREAQPRT
jgi:adenylate kinase family enzyme